MKIYLNNLNYKYEIFELIRVLISMEEILFVDNMDNKDDILIIDISENLIIEYIKEEKVEYKKSIDNFRLDTNEIIKEKIIIKREILKFFQEKFNLKNNWGVLTGIRPVKVARKLLNQYSVEDARYILIYEMLLSPNKANLILNISQVQKKYIKSLEKNSYSLYINIPFCPTRCDYCSFSTLILEKNREKVQPYLESIIHELESLKESLKDYKITTIYIGGGTPSSLNVKELEILLEYLNNNFIKSKKIEFTIEAGREDTLSYEKMKLFINYNITRISLNPQSFKKETLNLIGRKQDNNKLIERYYEAKELGFKSINMDLIIGLPKEDINDLRNTLNIIEKLSPDNLTVHTLALKKGSKFKEKSIDLEMEKNNINDMMGIVLEFARKNEYIPYYLYRQKQTLGGMENIGFAKKGKECIYNINMMEEVENIVGIGMGASSKFLKSQNIIENHRNYMNMRDYLNNLDKQIEEKKLLLGDSND